MFKLDLMVMFMQLGQFMMDGPAGEDGIGFSKSTDGGVTWSSARIYSAATLVLEDIYQVKMDKSFIFPFNGCRQVWRTK